MPFTFQIDRSKDLTIFTATGDVTFKEMISIFDSYYEAGSTHYEIYDFSRGTGETVTFKQIGQMIEKGASRPSHKNWQTAIVVSNDIGFKMARIFQGMTEIGKTPQKAKVFRSLDDAYEWLDIPPIGSGSD